MSKINIAQITSQVKSTFDSKINKLVNDAQNGTLNEETIQKEIEPYQKKFEQFEQASTIASAAGTAISAFRDPVGTAKSIAVRGVGEIIASSQSVQKLKQDALNKIGEKLNEFPQVQELKSEFDKVANMANDISIPEDPSIDPEYPSANKLVAAAIRDSRLARMLIKTE